MFEQFSHRLNYVIEVSQPVFHKLFAGLVISVFAVLVVQVIVENQKSAINSLFTHADNAHFAVVQLEKFSLVKIYLVNAHNFAVSSVITLQKIDAGPENAIEFGVHTFFEVKLDFVKRTLESFQQVAPDFSQFFILHVEFEVLQLELFTPSGGFFLGVCNPANCAAIVINGLDPFDPIFMAKEVNLAIFRIVVVLHSHF